MNCPQCNDSTQTVSFQDIEVDRCSSCKGFSFDAWSSAGSPNRQARKFSICPSQPHILGRTALRRDSLTRIEAVR